MTHSKFRKANRTDLLEPETWQVHPDFDLYEVSTYGRVRSWHKRLPHILKPAPGPYFQVVLIRDHLRYDRSVHRLVLETFVGYRPEGMVCRHLNGNSKDNRLTNLKWGTPKENSQDMVSHGTRGYGALNGRSKLTNRQVMEIRRLRSQGMEYQQIAPLYGITTTTAWGVAIGLTYSQLPMIQPRVRARRTA